MGSNIEKVSPSNIQDCGKLSLHSEANYNGNLSVFAGADTIGVLEIEMNKRFEAIVRFIEEEVPFDKYLGIRVDELREGFAKLFIPFREEFIWDKRRPALHGGLISTLIDTCGGSAALTHCAQDDRISTVDIRVDYLRPGPDDDIIAEAVVQRTGNRVSVVHTRVYAARDKKTVIAEGRSVYSITRVDS